MPVTRSSTRTTLKQSSQAVYSTSSVTTKSIAKSRRALAKAKTEPPIDFSVPPRVKEPIFIPAALSFAFQDAKEHLISVDARFSDVFKRLPCGPYEKLEPVDPFRYVHT